MPSSWSIKPAGTCRDASSCRPTSPSLRCRQNAPNSTLSKTSGNSCATTGSQIASSNLTTISSSTAARPGTNSSISPGASCPSDCVNGRTGSDQWDLVLGAPRLRNGKPAEHKRDKESVRRRQATANRVFTVLRAALNHAFRDGKISHDEWRKVQAFQSVDTARSRYLTIDEARRLLNACEPHFRLLVQAALQTGARYGQLAKLVSAMLMRYVPS